MLAEHACLVTCFNSWTVRDGCTTTIWSPSVKSFHVIIMLSCVFWVALHARYTDVFNVCGWCEVSSDSGCELVTGQSWNNGCCGQMVVVVVTLDTEPKGT